MGFTAHLSICQGIQHNSDGVRYIRHFKNEDELLSLTIREYLEGSERIAGAYNNRLFARRVREWAKSIGWHVEDHGRLPKELVHAYRERFPL